MSRLKRGYDRGVRLTASVRADQRVPFLQAGKAAIATVAAWVIASALLPTQLPVFAAIAALLVVQPSVNQSVGKAIERSIGVIVGVLLAYGIALVFGPTSWIVLVAVVVAIFVAWALRLTPGTSNQVPISAMLVLSIGTTNAGYAPARIIETIIGAVIAVIVNLLIVPPVLLAPAQQAIGDLAEEIAATLDRLADALRSVQSPAHLEELLLEARLLRAMEDKAASALKDAGDSLTFNPRGARRRDVLARESEFFARLPRIVTRALNMTRSVHDNYDDDLVEEPTVRAIVDELTRAAHDLRLRAATARGGRGTDARPPLEPPVLTAPLTVALPHPEHWVLIGALLEDLRRIHEEIEAYGPGADGSR
jgi:uncharacterized membrane protein YgaE (UPF0421/DUF939 family)